MVTAILRLLGSRCPECFKTAGPDAVRHGMQLFCSLEHRDKYLERGGVSKQAFARGGKSGGSCC